MSKRHIALFRLVPALAVALLFLAGIPCFGQGGGRHALVIGNGNYRSNTVSVLVNPVNDARDVAATLRQLGFSVREIIDGSREQMALAIDGFSRDLKGAEVGLFFFAGHGVQVDGRNYLIPVDVELPSSQVVPFRTIVADEVLAGMSAAGAKLNLFFLDACRDNPLPAESRNLQRGLAVVGNRPPETMIVYATQANATAADGTGRNSPFTQALLRHLPVPALDVYDLFRNVSSEVQGTTGGRQRPEQFGNVTVRYSLASGSLGSTATPAPGGPAASPAPTPIPTAVAPPSRPGFQVDQGSIQVSVQAAATIFVDGTERLSLGDGQSSAISGVEVGTREVEALYADGRRESRRITVAVSTPVSVAFSFGYGNVRVSLTTGGTVYLEGVEQGSLAAGQSATLTKLANGNHRLEVRYPNGQTETQQVMVGIGQTAMVTFTHIFGSLRVTAATAGTLWVDGSQAGSVTSGGSTSLNDILAGSRRVEIRYANGQSEQQTTTVSPNSAASAAFTKAWGSLRVTAATAGTLWVDGSQADSVTAGGSTSLNDILAGSRRVEIRYANGQSESISVTVIPSASTESIKFNYRQEPLPALITTGQSWTSPSGIKFMAVPGGSFAMGSSSGGSSDERPVRQVSLTGFWLAATEVTQGQWQAVMGSNPSDTSRGIGSNHPVNRVSWYDALVFCNRLSMKEGLAPVYSIGGSSDPDRWGAVPTSGNSTWNAVTANLQANGYRLPTEAQWEYAAKGGEAGVRQNVAYSGSNDANAVAWYDANSGGKTQPVATRAANQLGLYDMSGNVWEWVWDWYGSYPGSAQSDPAGPASGSYRVSRGGSWDLSATNLRPALRDYDSPDYRINYLGFRLARPPVR